MGATHTSDPAVHLREPLTPTEEKVLHLLAQGMSDKEIGLELNLAPITIRGDYKQSIYDKLNLQPGFRNRKWAVHYARQAALLPGAREDLDNVPPGDNPYKGLDAFQQHDAQVFFGREAFVERLLTRLSQNDSRPRFLAVVGPSGSGKSSILRAGLIPALGDDRIPGARTWVVTTMFPRVNPFFELETALRTVAIKQQADLLAVLQRDAYGLARAARLILPEEHPLLLVIDQFEENFTLVEDSALARRFMDLIYAAVTDPRSTVRVIITLRADFLDRPLMYPDFSWLVQEHTAMVVPLTPDELERAITLPAQQAHVTIEPGLVARLVAEAHEQPGALPLLEFALTELYDNRIGRTITMGAYDEIGGVQQALAAQADKVFSGLSSPQQETARQLFLRLITLGEGTEDTRRRVPTRELASLETPAETMNYVIHFLAANRLVTLDLDSTTKEPLVEVAHEALIREWIQLRTWLDESRDDVRLQRMLAAAAHEWVKAGHDRSYLLTGSRLAQFEGWAEQTDVALTPDERAFVDASSAEDRRQRIRRRRIRNTAVIASATVALLMTVLALIAFRQRANAQEERDNAQRQATVNHSLVLANSAHQAYENGDTILAVSLALEAASIDSPPAEVEQTLREIAQGSGIRSVIEGHSAIVKAVALSPDGRYALSGSCGDVDANGICTSGKLILWDVQAKSEVVRMEGHTDWVNRVIFAPDGQTMLSGSSDGTAILWVVPSGEMIRRFEGHTAGVNSVAFSPDGSTFITGSADTTVIRWNIETGAMIQRYEGHVGEVNCAVFSPDGQTILSGSDDTTLILWDVASGERLMSFEGHEASVSGAALTPGGRAVSAARNGSLHLWDVATGEQLQQHRFVGATPDFALAPDGRTALVPEMGHLRVWNIEQWQYQYGLAYYEKGKPGIASVAFSGDGQMGIYGTEDGDLVLWNVPSTGEVRRWDDNNTRYVYVIVSPDGRYLLGGTLGGDAVLLDRESGEEIRRFQDHNGVIFRLTFSPDGRYALVSSGDFFGTSGRGSFILWDVETGTQIRSFEGYQYLPTSVNFSPDGQLVIGSTTQYGDAWDESNGGETVVWDTATGEEVVRLDTEWWVNESSFTSDGNSIITGSGDSDVKGVVVWDLSSGQEVNRFLPTTPILNIVLIPGSTLILAGAGNGEIIQLDYETGEVIRRFCCHSDMVRYVDLSADQRYVISGDNSGVVILWDFATGQEIRSFYGHQGMVWGVSFSLDGQTAYSAGTDGRIIEWQITDPPLDDLLAWVHENRYIREFTCEERAQYRIEPLCEE